MIGSSENRVSYNGNGNAKEFAFEFKILNASDIKVLLVNADGTEKLLTKDYFVDIEKSVVRYPGYAPGAELPLEQQPPILPTGSKLVLYREVPITQQTKLDQFWPFNVIEAALDKLTIICQQLSDGFSRCLKLSESVPKDVNPTIPVEAGKSFRWSDDGKKIVLTDDPAKVLPLASDALNKAEAARDVAIAKADAAGASAVSAAESETAADRSATQAEAAKTAAEASETAAAKSAAAAKVSEGNAKTSETNALTHEGNAKASADKAKVSETNAGASASTATTKASQASVSATNAQRAASQADVSAVQAGHAMTNATAKAEEASVSAANAKTSETNAKTSETNAKASETKAKTSETNAGKSATDATTKAGEASASATNAKASETAAKVSETNAKSSEGKAKTSETNAGVSAATATQQATKATTEANRAKTEADRAKTAADSVGNPVVNITQSNGNLTITKGDGSSNTLTVTPAVASLAEAEAGTDNTKMMTPLRVAQVMATGLNNVALLEGSLNQFIIDNQFLGEVQQGCVRKLESDISTLVDIGVDALIINLTSGNKVIIDAKQIFGGVANSIVRVCTIVLTGSVSAPIEWVNCKMMCEAPPKNSNKDTIVTFYITADTHYLVSAMEEG